MHALREQAPWWVVGPAFGLVVIGLIAALNERIGIVGGFSEVVERLEGRRLRWKAFFLFGIVGGAALYTAVGGGFGRSGYGWLTRTFTGDARIIVAPILVGGGALIGYGAKTAGGCTSGNGLGGCSTGSPAGFAATGTFMGVAIAGTFVLRWLFG
ncbi:MAG: uncharacterized protein QOE36_116 [Gaiellaceae bacterium]|nr:uncharacterized protein [Gaiellaceae bacterium]